MTLLGGLTGALSNTTANKTSTYSQNQSNNGTNTYAQNLNPAQSAVLGPESTVLQQMMSNPTGYVQPFATSAVNSINQGYNGLSNSLAQQFLSTGGGSSGKYGEALANSNLARAGQIAGSNASMAQTAASLPIQASQLANGLLGLNFGGTTSTSGSSSTSGTNVGAGSPLAGAAQGATAGASSDENMYLMQQLMSSMASM